MASGGDNDKGSIAGASYEQDGAVDARADHPPHTEMGNPRVVCTHPISQSSRLVDLLPDLSIAPTDIPALRLDLIEEDNPKGDPSSHVQDYSDEVKAAIALIMMKHQVPVLQQRQMEQNPRQVEMEQNPRQMEFLASDGDHHESNAAAGASPQRLRIPRGPRSHRVGWPRKRSVLRLKKYVLRFRSQGIL